MSVLDDIISGVRDDLERRRAETSETDLRARLLDLPPALDPMPRLVGPGSSVIAGRNPRPGQLSRHLRPDTPVDPESVRTRCGHAFKAMPGALGEDDRQHLVLQRGDDLPDILHAQLFEIFGTQ